MNKDIGKILPMICLGIWEMDTNLFLARSNPL